MQILILGGTSFVGFHIVQCALDRGHEVTLFNRGKTGAGKYEGVVEHLAGDRDPKDPSDTGGLKALEGTRRWDVVIDVSGYVPRIVGASAKLLAERCSTYLYVSTISVYKLPFWDGEPELSPHATIDDTDTEVIDGRTYGALKSLCEAEVLSACPESNLIVRPGIVAGPQDYTDRFTYWVKSAHEAQGQLLCPGTPDARVQAIDARDMCRWMVEMAEAGARGVYNAAGPKNTFTRGEMIAACLAAAGNGATPVWLPWDFLAEHEVTPWQDMPLCLNPELAPDDLYATDSSKAYDAGLSIRSLTETAKDTLAWLLEDPDRKLATGLALAKAEAVLAAWNAKQGSG